MPKVAKSLFDPKLVLAKVGEGKTILKFDKNQVVFSHASRRASFITLRSSSLTFRSIALRASRSGLTAAINAGRSSINPRPAARRH
jgi:hypothetical protein